MNAAARRQPATERMMAVLRRSRRTRRSDPVDVEEIEPDDVIQIEAGFAAVDAEEGHDRDRRLATRLRPLVVRGVPARSVEVVRGMRATRVRFADGTAVVVRGVVPGDVGVLAAWVKDRTVVAEACPVEDDGTHLVFRPRGSRRTMSVLVTGFDQPD